MHSDEKIYNYIKNYFSNEEFDLLRRYYNEEYDFDDTSLDDPEYTDLEFFYKKLINHGLLDNYRIEVGPSGSYLIEELFYRYVDKDTFVISSEKEHSSVRRSLPSNNCFILNDKDFLDPTVFNRSYEAFKQSSCTKVFLIISGTTIGFSQVTDQSLFVHFKQTFNNVPNIFVLDDAQGVFATSRNYELFDAILTTAHVIVPGFDMGLLFTKLNKKIGFVNKAGLKHLLEKLTVLYRHRSKALEFNSLLTEFFKDSIDQNPNFDLFSNQISDKFAIKTTNIKFNQKYADSVAISNIRFNTVDTPINFIRIRNHEAIIQDPNLFVNSLKSTKNIINKLQRETSLRNFTANDFSRKELLTVSENESFAFLNNFYHFTPKDAEKVKNIIRNREFYLNSIRQKIR